MTAALLRRPLGDDWVCYMQSKMICCLYASFLGFIAPEDFETVANSLRDDINMTVFVTSMRQELDALAGRVSTTEIRQNEVKEEVFSKAQEQDEILNRLKGRVEKQSNAIEDLYENVEMLKDAALQVSDNFLSFQCRHNVFLQYRPPAIAVFIRKHLDNARFSVVDGFLTLFPRSLRSLHCSEPLQLRHTICRLEGF